MTIKNKALLIVSLFILAIVLAILSVLAPIETVTDFLSSYKISFYVLNIANILGIILLVQNGKIFKTKYWKRIMLFFPLIAIGLLAKIQHWEIANPLLIAGICGVQIIYLIWFISKKIPTYLDWLKLIWVISYGSIRLLIVLHYADKDLSFICVTLILLACIEVWRTNNGKSKTFEFDFLKIKKN